MLPSSVVKPTLRGRLHQVAFFLSIPAGIALVGLARTTAARVAAVIFAVTLTGLYGVSAAYHRGEWSIGAHRLMKHLDHSMIFVFIAGTYTPIALLALLVGGGVLYTVGAVVLARRRPDPHPAVFGYHEVWHTFVVGANACHFVLVALLVRA